MIPFEIRCSANSSRAHPAMPVVPMSDNSFRRSLFALSREKRLVRFAFLISFSARRVPDGSSPNSTQSSCKREPAHHWRGNLLHSSQPESRKASSLLQSHKPIPEINRNSVYSEGRLRLAQPCPLRLAVQLVARGHSTIFINSAHRPATSFSCCDGLTTRLTSTDALRRQ